MIVNATAISDPIRIPCDCVGGCGYAHFKPGAIYYYVNNWLVPRWFYRLVRRLFL